MGRTFSEHGYRPMGEGWYNFEERKGFSTEVVADVSTNPSLRAWVSAMMKNPIPSNEFWFFIIGYHPDVDRPTQDFALAARVEGFGIPGLRARLCPFVS